MRVLLDTHVALWALVDAPRLSSSARMLIEDSRNILFVSAATVWEISIKRTISPEKMPISGGEAVQFFQRAGYRFLDISPEHASRVETLPRHHNDPFDRLIVAQALIEPLVLVTSDRILSLYSDSFIIVP